MDAQRSQEPLPGKDGPRLRGWVGMAKHPGLAPTVMMHAVTVHHPDGLQEVFQVLAVLLRDEGPRPQQQELVVVCIELPLVDGKLWTEALCGTGAPGRPTAGSPGRKAGCTVSVQRPSAARGPAL